MAIIKSWNNRQSFKRVSRWLNTFRTQDGERKFKYQGKTYTLRQWDFPITMSEECDVDYLSGYANKSYHEWFYVEQVGSKVRLYEEIEG